jgi:hypothetical protein
MLGVDVEPVKDVVRLQTPGTHSISCECGKVYIGQTGGLYKSGLKNTKDM